jgi:hypothetical protein
VPRGGVLADGAGDGLESRNRFSGRSVKCYGQPVFVPVLALGGFVRLRTAEIERLGWGGVLEL